MSQHPFEIEQMIAEDEAENEYLMRAGLPTAQQRVDEQEGSTTRAAHMAWCKGRALELVEQGDVQGAYASMVSDLQKHEATRGHVGIGLGMMQMMGGMLNSPAQMRHFIEGFN
jgi:hypothetical protein